MKAISCISCSKASHIAFSVLSSMLVWLYPFLYSRGQSSNMILGLRICLRILGWVISLLTITPLSTSLSSSVPPGIFYILAYRFISKFNLFFVPSLRIILVAVMVKLEISFPQRLANLVPMQLWRAISTSSSLDTSIGLAISYSTFLANYRAL